MNPRRRTEDSLMQSARLKKMVRGFDTFTL